jgi:hypothetical protein
MAEAGSANILSQAVSAGLGGIGRTTLGPPEMRGRIPRRSKVQVTLENIDWWAIDPYLLLDILPEISPDVGLALHNVLRLANPGWSLELRHPDGKIDVDGTRLVNEMFGRANRGVDSEIPGAMGGPNSFINTLLLSAYMKGAMCAETVLTPELNGLDDIVAVEPTTIEFRYDEEDTNRRRWRIGQLQPRAKERWRELNPNLITYIGVDDDLYGRAPVAPALQIIPFWLRFYQELQVFLHHSAWGFIDGEVSWEGLYKAWEQMDADERVRYHDEFFAWALAQVRRFADAYRMEGKRDPDALIAHLDLLKLTSQSRGNTSFPITGVAELCKKEIYAALKMLPVFMGSNEGTTETHGTVQMAIFNSGLKRFQDMARHIIQRSLYVGLWAMGYDREVRMQDIIFEFDAIATEERLTAARAASIEAKTAAFKRDEGWISQDDASIEITGTEAVGDSKQPVNGQRGRASNDKIEPELPNNDDASKIDGDLRRKNNNLGKLDNGNGLNNRSKVRLVRSKGKRRRL